MNNQSKTAEDNIRAALNAFRFNGKRIPEYMHDGIVNYLVRRVPPGDFLSAVLCNDFMGAVGKADDTNIELLQVYAAFLYNETPAPSHGSLEAFKRWIGCES